ncbi:hypothetical protein GCM10012285_41090 [Streptomyces kronopolitis]|uniref:Uncharacterized protein n=1 Tax=Streptomyces kronopolitis TaxID=1612435 RepID=A0ABQ2JM15_9ACTN|nr:hypothetical protein GCM10012285_41090 [Streptomyces kronopolitis]
MIARVHQDWISQRLAPFGNSIPPCDLSQSVIMSILAITVRWRSVLTTTLIIVTVIQGDLLMAGVILPLTPMVLADRSVLTFLRVWRR